MVRRWLEVLGLCTLLNVLALGVPDADDFDDSTVLIQNIFHRRKADPDAIGTAPKVDLVKSAVNAAKQAEIDHQPAAGNGKKQQLMKMPDIKTEVGELQADLKEAMKAKYPSWPTLAAQGKAWGADVWGGLVEDAGWGGAKDMPQWQKVTRGILSPAAVLATMGGKNKTFFGFDPKKDRDVPTMLEDLARNISRGNAPAALAHAAGNQTLFFVKKRVMNKLQQLEKDLGASAITLGGLIDLDKARSVMNIFNHSYKGVKELIKNITEDSDSADVRKHELQMIIKELENKTQERPVVNALSDNIMGYTGLYVKKIEDTALNGVTNLVSKIESKLLTNGTKAGTRIDAIAPPIEILTDAIGPKSLAQKQNTGVRRFGLATNEDEGEEAIAARNLKPVLAQETEQRQERRVGLIGKAKDKLGAMLQRRLRKSKTEEDADLEEAVDAEIQDEEEEQEDEQEEEQDESEEEDETEGEDTEEDEEEKKGSARRALTNLFKRKAPEAARGKVDDLVQKALERRKVQLKAAETL